MALDEKADVVYLKDHREREKLERYESGFIVGAAVVEDEFGCSSLDSFKRVNVLEE